MFRPHISEPDLRIRCEDCGTRFSVIRPEGNATRCLDCVIKSFSTVKKPKRAETADRSSALSEYQRKNNDRKQWSRNPDADDWGEVVGDIVGGIFDFFD